MGEMTSKVTFGDNASAFDAELAGIPLSEAVTRMTVGPCIKCGAAPEDVEGGMLDNMRIERGVLRGDHICEACCRDEDPDFMLDAHFEL